MQPRVIPASLCFRPLARTLVAIAIGAMSSLASGLSLAETHPGEEKSSCTTNLTCGRETKVISALNYHRIIPDLAQWQQLSLEQGTDFQPVARASKPYRFHDPTTGMAFARVPGACYRIETAAAEANTSPPRQRGRTVFASNPSISASMKSPLRNMTASLRPLTGKCLTIMVGDAAIIR